MTTIYLDTEYNGFGGSLISIALVGTDLNYWYAVTDFVHMRQMIDPWVVKNVLPHLETTGFTSSAGRPLHDEMLKASFIQFISRYENATIVADWFEDIEHFLSLLRGKDYGSSLNWKGTFKLIGRPDEIHSKVPHNALSDAMALMRWHTQEMAA